MSNDGTASLLPALRHAAEQIAQARRELWWFIETYTDEDDDTVARAMSIQDRLLYPALTAIQSAVPSLEALIVAVEAEFVLPTAANQDATREALEAVQGRPVGGWLPAPGMTDLMVTPESIDAFLAENPPPVDE
jgi:hypothetical protein